MLLCVGLGNPGQQYLMTRHNIGFMAIDTIASTYDFPVFKKQFQAEYSERKFKEIAVSLLKPQTYMNVSGASVLAAMTFYKLKLEQILVMHDDIDLIPGQVKLKLGGGAGGHNGLKSIDHTIGNNYWRLRLGVGHPGDRHLVTNYVLSAFPSTDHDWLTDLLQKIAHEFVHLPTEKPDIWVKRLVP